MSESIIKLFNGEFTKKKENKYEPRLPEFNGNDGDDCDMWSRKVEATLEDTHLADTLTNDSAELDMDRSSHSIIVKALLGNPLRLIKGATNTKESWQNRRSRYAGKSIEN